MKYVYRMANGLASDLRAVSEDYAPQPGEIVGHDEPLPPIERLHELAGRQAIAWERIKKERDRRAQNGGYLAGGKWFHSDIFSRTQQLGLKLLGNSIPAGTRWKAMDGTFIEMTPALAQQIFAAAAASDIAVFAAAQAHKAAMEAAADPAAYNFSGGWPAVFGE